MKKISTFTLRIESTLLNKLHFIADYEGRSANKQIEQLIKRAVQEFEAKHGAIRINAT